MLRLITHVLQESQDFLKPLFFLSAWFLLFALTSTLFRAIADVIKRTKKMHAIPCSDCSYFTNDYRLKCTVQPHLASTEQAVSCPDFCRVED
jgi:hypothetical protein